LTSTGVRTAFTGYDGLELRSRVLLLVKEGEKAGAVTAGDAVEIVTEKTPFYAESGGQVGDSGYLCAEGMRFEVRDTRKAGAVYLHHGVVLQGAVAVADTLQARVDDNVRGAIARNHSATHLLHAALRQVLGSHVTQKGSLVDSQRLRFDFSHFDSLTADELRAVEDCVNGQIRSNSEVAIELTDMETAKQRGAMALFGEKYGDQVRVLTMGDGFSVELCGGTHVQRTGDIGLLRIVSEAGVAAGVRRIEAVTGAIAMGRFDQAEQQLAAIATMLKSDRDSVAEKIELMLANQRKLEKQLEKLQARLAGSTGTDLAATARDIAGIRVLAARLDTADGKTLRDTMDQLKNKLGAAAIVLAGVDGDKVALVAGVTKAESERVKAGELLKMVAQQIGGKGGGRPDMAQGGGGDPAAVPAALASVLPWVEQRLKH
jgi:alanyl-tRNA synthetase